QVPGYPAAPHRAGGDREPPSGDGVRQLPGDSDRRARPDARPRQLELGWEIEGSREVGEPYAARQFFVSESAVRSNGGRYVEPWRAGPEPAGQYAGDDGGAAVRDAGAVGFGDRSRIAPGRPG